MAENALIDVGKLTKPATILIEKISNAIGIVYEPTRIRRKAIADADASKTKAISNLEIDDIEKRALNRLVTEETKKQENIENIMNKSLPLLEDNAKPEDIEDDWISNFFDKCKLISDDEMQTLWSKILVGESNSPGRFSKRTVEFMAMMDKNDALLFEKFSKLCWWIDGYQPVILKSNSDEFKKFNISFAELQHLCDIGLISYETLGFTLKYNNTDNPNIRYYGRRLNVEFNETRNNSDIETGEVLISKIGKDLLEISKPEIRNGESKRRDAYNDDVYHYVVKEFYKQGLLLSEPLINSFYK